MKYFGTDGIRGEINKDLNYNLIKKVAKAVVIYYKKHKLNKTLLVGNDSRISSDYILGVLSSVLLCHGIEIHNVGVCSSPCLAYLTKKYNYPLSLMISASHNPSNYNGIKFFNNRGEKVDDCFEQEFETYMSQNLPTQNDFTIIKNVEKIKQDYVAYLKQIKHFDIDCIIDCANGGTSEICKQIFNKFEKINIRPNGNNINENAGCTHIEKLKSLCIKKQKIGFAFDGDGDRIHVVTTNGYVITGDKILYILSKFFQKSGDSLIGTIYTNTGLENCLKQRNILLKRAPVGDKNVYKLMTENNSTLGGEDSGHIILKPYSNTGDGVLIAIVLSNILQLSKLSIDELLENYTEYYQYKQNINLYDKFSATDNLKQTIKSYEKQGSKVIIRPSGTEPVLRIFVENKNETLAKTTLSRLVEIIKKVKDTP